MSDIKIPKGKCVSMYPGSSVIIMENLDVYEIYFEDQDILDNGGIPSIELKANYFVRKLPMKATIDFSKVWGNMANGDNGIANWVNNRLPVEISSNKLKWDY